MSIWQNPADGTLHDDMDGAALALPSWPQGMTQLTDEQALALQNPAPTAATLWADYQASAQALLTASDKTVLRCYENSVVVPGTWAIYRKDLRAIIAAVSGDPTQALPTNPAYPPNT